MNSHLTLAPEAPVASVASVAPVAIGGVGGSGTRLIAELVHRLGYFIGRDLNCANDNLWFTLLFKRWELWGRRSDEFDRSMKLFQSAMLGGETLTAEDLEFVDRLAAVDRLQHSAEWLQQRRQSLIAAMGRQRLAGAWAWKEPNTHIFLDRFASALPGLKYIHVLRNGLDMAFAANQNQVRLWGPQLLGDRPDIEAAGPRVSLNFWCVVNRRAISLGRTMGGRFLLVNYDAFCAAPVESLRILAGFLQVTLDRATEASLSSLVRPQSIGRFKQSRAESFDAADIAYVQSLGFDTARDQVSAPPIVA